MNILEYHYAVSSLVIRPDHSWIWRAKEPFPKQRKSLEVYQKMGLEVFVTVEKAWTDNVKISSNEIIDFTGDWLDLVEFLKSSGRGRMYRALLESL